MFEFASGSIGIDFIQGCYTGKPMEYIEQFRGL